MTTRPLTLTAPDRETIRQILASRNISSGEARTLADLIVGLSESVTVRSENVPPSVVTLNSRVRVRTLGTEMSRVLTLVAGPSDIAQGRISVLTPVGAGLLGRSEGDIVECDAPAGPVRMRIEALLYQPEAAGVFDPVEASPAP